VSAAPIIVRQLNVDLIDSAWKATGLELLQEKVL
jgi:hypothetical protein